jgi:uncharacterized protein YggU (UPF0235/DUF167 family)
MKVLQVKVKVTAGAGKNVVDGFVEGYLQVRVKAPAREGRANREVRRVVASFLGLEEDRVRILERWRKSRKTLLLDISGKEGVMEKLRQLGFIAQA